MDCPNSGAGDRSLPSMGMGVPRWMKRATERYDYSDICASPPSHEDGFIHINRNRLRQMPATDAGQSNTNVECYQNQKKRSFRTETADITTSIVELERGNRAQASAGIGITSATSKRNCSNVPETTSFFKNVATTTAPLPTQCTRTHVTSVTTPFKKQISSISKSETGQRPTYEPGNTYDSALDLHGEIPSMVVTKPDQGLGASGSLKQLIEKMNGINVPSTPDETPNPTPTVTPACSPQIARRAGNPFFSGTPAQSNNSGSWLFRPSSAVVSTTNNVERTGEQNYLYEARSDYPKPMVAEGVTGPGSTTKKNVRYVPRPSELREINFWSPTSM